VAVGVPGRDDDLPRQVAELWDVELIQAVAVFEQDIGALLREEPAVTGGGISGAFGVFGAREFVQVKGACGRADVFSRQRESVWVGEVIAARLLNGCPFAGAHHELGVRELR